MTELVLVRHAQASFGADDYDRLSELGWRQSRWLGEYFAERGVTFNSVRRGSLRRHAQTLAGIAQGVGRDLDAGEDPRLDEYDSQALLHAHLKGGPMPRSADRREHFRILREAHPVHQLQQRATPRPARPGGRTDLFLIFLRKGESNKHSLKPLPISGI